MQGTLLEIDRRVEPIGDVVEVRGELDLTNAPSLDDALSEVTGSTVILDVGALAFIDSAGIRTIDQAHRRFAESGRKLLIVAGAESRAAWTFRVAGFADGFVLESLAEAQARADAQPGS
jgi:anti-sigma B factor antagonist